jgi:hypothetical protein
MYCLYVKLLLRLQDHYNAHDGSTQPNDIAAAAIAAALFAGSS